MAQLWVDPGDLTQRDLFWGSGGRDLAPDVSAPFEWISTKDEISSYSLGYRVRDRNGLQWSVKVSDEVQPEVLASRLIWSVGYHQLPAYYVASWQMLKDGKVKTQPEARFRPLPKLYKKIGTWSWQQNPYVGSRPYHGLVALMIMINNFDISTPNNAIYDLRRDWEGTRRWYLPQDVGASFSGNRGKWFPAQRHDLKGFKAEGFIDHVEDGKVVFSWTGWHQDLIRNIPAADVRWLGQLLSRLTARQWDDALRAANYQGEQAELIRNELAARIRAAAEL